MVNGCWYSVLIAISLLATLSYSFVIEEANAPWLFAPANSFEPGHKTVYGQRMITALTLQKNEAFSISSDLCKGLDHYSPDLLYTSIMDKLPETFDNVKSDFFRNYFPEFQRPNTTENRLFSKILAGVIICPRGERYLQAYSHLLSVLLHNLKPLDACAAYHTLISSDYFYNLASGHGTEEAVIERVSNFIDRNFEEHAEYMRSLENGGMGIQANVAVLLQTMLFQSVPVEYGGFASNIVARFIENGADERAFNVILAAVLLRTTESLEELKDNHDLPSIAVYKREWLKSYFPPPPPTGLKLSFMNIMNTKVKKERAAIAMFDEDNKRAAELVMNYMNSARNSPRNTPRSTTPRNTPGEMVGR